MCLVAPCALAAGSPALTLLRRRPWRPRATHPSPTFMYLPVCGFGFVHATWQPLVEGVPGFWQSFFAQSASDWLNTALVAGVSVAVGALAGAWQRRCYVLPRRTCFSAPR